MKNELFVIPLRLVSTDLEYIRIDNRFRYAMKKAHNRFITIFKLYTHYSLDANRRPESIYILQNKMICECHSMISSNIGIIHISLDNSNSTKYYYNLGWRISLEYLYKDFEPKRETRSTLHYMLHFFFSFSLSFSIFFTFSISSLSPSLLHSISLSLLSLGLSFWSIRFAVIEVFFSLFVFHLRCSVLIWHEKFIQIRTKKKAHKKVKMKKKESRGRMMNNKKESLPLSCSAYYAALVDSHKKKS